MKCHEAFPLSRAFSFAIFTWEYRFDIMISIMIGNKRLTYDVQIAVLRLRSRRINLAHVPSLIIFLHLFDM